jgi:predicted metallopeptidase
MQRLCAIFWPFMAPLAPPYFSTLSHKRQDFRKKAIELKILRKALTKKNEIYFTSKLMFVALKRVSNIISINAKTRNTTKPSKISTVSVKVFSLCKSNKCILQLTSALHHYNHLTLRNKSDDAIHILVSIYFYTSMALRASTTHGHLFFVPCTL